MLLIFESLLVRFQELKGLFIFYEGGRGGGGGAGGIWKASYKNRVTPLSLSIFFLQAAPPSPVIFFGWPLPPTPQEEKINPLSSFYLF